MNSTREQLEKRGCITFLERDHFLSRNDEELYQLVQSKKATDRTMAIHVLACRLEIDDLSFSTFLLQCLEKETALYTKLEISKTLEAGGRNTCRALISYLGKIGTNQYRQVPPRVSKKKSYPLPRDIVARILGHMKEECIDDLFVSLLKLPDRLQTELLDAIGFFLFYHPTFATIERFEVIRDLIDASFSNDLLVWKGVLCLSAFPLSENEIYLSMRKQEVVHPVIQQEIERSLQLIKRHPFE